ncbi:hypothetical protein [Clostridium sp. BNL1100]|uniref:hypothetical protein n=1 Tax=Clostridium sp. BNL1100 TaxID=755731 RepID=UPI00024A7F1B|nr:hypothetical protein [Clostridium sp. BNL1100]AEY65428.1 hypothetical protein Clo1100_1176 [Clostridium sp. BNL1100]
MKKFISGLIAGAILACSITAFATNLKVIDNPYPVLINNKQEDVKGYNVNGSTYLKLSDFTKAGLDVKFDKDKGQIDIVNKVVTTQNNNPYSDMDTTVPKVTINID